MIHVAAELGVADQLAAGERPLEELAKPVALLCRLGDESAKKESHPGVPDPPPTTRNPRSKVDTE
jgi:hypothetical protein